MRVDYAQRFYNFVSEKRPEYKVLGQYISSDTKILIEHLICGHTWMVRPHDFKDKLSNCPVCSEKIKLENTRKVNSEAFYTYVSKYRPQYEVLSTYTNNSTKLVIKHKFCGHEWEATPNAFKDAGTSCPHCVGKLKITTQEFSNWIKLNRPEYSLLTAYVNTDTKVKLLHNCCGYTWHVTPHDFKSGSNCPKCSRKRTYSTASITQLSDVSSKLNISIQHAKNGEEFKIPGTRYKADGYCKETNTIFEYHGIAYHGGYDPRRNILVSAILGKSPEELFKATVHRMNTIIAKGFKLFYVFDIDYTDNYLGDYY